MLFGLFAFSAKATHITGGEMYYTYDGLVNGQHQYSVTLKLYQRCNSGRQFPDPTIISIFDKATGTRFTDLTVPIGLTDNISINNPDPCITNPPSVCYDIAYYYFVIALPPSSSGWVLASEVNYRINGISNLGGGNIGATYTAEIPGNGQIADAPINNSAVFTGSDLVVICANNDFNYSFGADDPDGDQLVYSFCYAYNSTSNGGGGGNPTGPPPFPSVQYNFPQFDGMTPLGSGVVVNSNTGLITGVAPDIGFYVVTVCVQEIRNGVVIATQRKDIQVYVADCEVAAASLQPEYQLCGNTRTITFSNLSTSPLITR